MKCPMCDGTGTSNTCVNGTFKPCSFCDGTGEFDPNEVDRFNAVDVIKVMEMVKKPMTNEEWLRTANVNDMARCIATKLLELARHEYGIYDVVDYATVFEWLKEKHE